MERDAHGGSACKVANYAAAGMEIADGGLSHAGCERVQRCEDVWAGADAQVK